MISALLVAFCTLRASAQTPANADSVLTIDARGRALAPERGYLKMGSPRAGKSPDGHVLSVNSRYLTLDGKPWLPVMGEFHYTRYPESNWEEEEILKMRARGRADHFNLHFLDSPRGSGGTVRLVRSAQPARVRATVCQAWSLRVSAHRPVGARWKFAMAVFRTGS